MVIKQNLDMQVYNLLIESFYNEEYIGGQILSPADIANKYGISKTPVLQALKRLETEKILTVSSGGKYTLVCPDAENIKNICATRYMFEKTAVEQVIGTVIKKQYEEMLSLVEGCKFLKDVDETKGILKADYIFHKYLVSLMNNNIINEFFESIVNRYILLKYVWGYQNQLQGLFEKSYGSHKKIAELLYIGKEKELLEFLREHIYFE